MALNLAESQLYELSSWLEPKPGTERGPRPAVFVNLKHGKQGTTPPSPFFMALLTCTKSR